MAPLAVVEDLDVLLDCRFGVGPCGVPLMMNHLVFQAAPEALHRRVVVAVPLARHRCLHAELRDQFAIVVGAILGGFNWSSQHQIIEQILDTRPVLRPEFSNPVFFVVWNSMH